jgi:mRNA interferase HigB
LSGKISEIASALNRTYYLPNWEVAAMRIIALSALRIFWESQPGYRDAKTPLVELYRHMEKAIYPTPQALKAELRTASILKAGRVVFNIGGNKYRVIMAINYQRQLAFIRFVGTHAQYDQINAETV